MDDSQPMNNPVLKTVNLGYRYHDGVTALENIEFEIADGESLAIIGPNGAGKSTLLLSLVGLLHYSGEIYIKGLHLTQKNIQTARKHIAMVFQDPDDQLFMPVLEEDIAFGPKNLGLDSAEVHRRVEMALNQMNIEDMRARPPHHLSFGEKRRAALATALAMEAEILLLDEPTSNLDPATRYELSQYLSSIKSTLVIATHDLELAKNLCTHCILLSGGGQIAFGMTEQVISDTELLRQHRLIAP